MQSLLLDYYFIYRFVFVIMNLPYYEKLFHLNVTLIKNKLNLHSRIIIVAIKPKFFRTI